MVHSINSMFRSTQGFSGSNGAISGSIKSKMAADGHLGMTALSRVTAVARNPCVSWAFLSYFSRHAVSFSVTISVQCVCPLHSYVSLLIVPMQHKIQLSLWCGENTSQLLLSRFLRFHCDVKTIIMWSLGLMMLLLRACLGLCIWLHRWHCYVIFFNAYLYKYYTIQYTDSNALNDVSRAWPAMKFRAMPTF